MIVDTYPSTAKGMNKNSALLCHSKGAVFMVHLATVSERQWCYEVEEGKMAKIEECFGYKSMWFAIKDVEADRLLFCCPYLKYVRETTWGDGLREIEEQWQSKAMLSGPYDGWTFLAGICLWDVSEVDQIVNIMSHMGECAGEVCFFASHRVSDAYAFAKMEQGKLIRLYSYADGQIFGCIGKKSDVEERLHLHLAEREEDLFEDEFDSLDEEDVLRIASEWSMNLETLFGREEARTIILEKICH